MIACVAKTVASHSAGFLLCLAWFVAAASPGFSAGEIAAGSGTNDGDAPFDVDTLTVVASANLQAGDAAPEFSVKLLDDKPLNLSDYRGKFALLDYWPTWCGPCRAEMPNIKSTWDAFGKDKRFAMVSLSLDSEPAAPGKYARDEGIAWTQGFLGDGSKDKVTVSYRMVSSYQKMADQSSPRGDGHIF